jgi:hypothetical protein
MKKCVRRTASFLLLVGVGLIVALPTGGAAAQRQAKAFPPGCWKGTGQGFLGPKSLGAIGSFKIDKSSFTFVLHATENTATGTLGMTGHGAGTANGGGVSAKVDLGINGNLHLAGKPAHVVATGTVRYKGEWVLLGKTQVIDFPRPVGLPLTIKTVAPQKVTGIAGGSPWVAVPCS